MTALVTAGCLMQLCFIYCDYTEKQTAALFTKTAAAFVFVTAGFALVRSVNDKIFGLLVMAGLVCGFSGDVLLRLRYISPKQHDKYFKLGTAVFMLGHFFYIAALLSRDISSVPAALAVSVIAELPMLFIMDRLTAPPKRFRWLGIVYITVILLMSMSAWTLFVKYPEIKGYMRFAVAATCFTFSDMLLMVSMFGRNPSLKKILSSVNLLFYYAAQILIALSLSFF